VSGAAVATTSSVSARCGRVLRITAAFIAPRGLRRRGRAAEGVRQLVELRAHVRLQGDLDPRRVDPQVRREAPARCGPATRAGVRMAARERSPATSTRPRSHARTSPSRGEFTAERRTTDARAAGSMPSASQATWTGKTTWSSRAPSRQAQALARRAGGPGDRRDRTTADRRRGSPDGAWGSRVAAVGGGRRTRAPGRAAGAPGGARLGRHRGRSRRPSRPGGCGHARACGLATVTLMTLTSRGDGK
jgi:hypothetical protein